MTEQLSPSIKTTRVKSGSPTIAGVATGTGGFLGVTKKGPVNLPQLITSPEQFKTVFGDPISGSQLYAAVDGFFKNGGSRCYVNRVVHYSSLSTPTTSAAKAAITLNDSSPAAAVKIEAINEGTWGNELSVTTTKDETLITTVAAGFSAGALGAFIVASAANLAVGDLLKIDDGVGTAFYCVIQSISGNTVTPVTGTTATVQTASTKVYLETFTIKTLDKDGLTLQTDTGLRMSELSAKNYFPTKVNVDGSIIKVTDMSGSGDITDDRPANVTASVLTGGNDGGTVVDADVVGNAANFLGLNAFDKIDDGALLSAPGWTSSTVQLSGTQYCNSRGDLYWVGSGANSQSPSSVKTFKTVTANLAVQEAGFYYPNIKVIDPLTAALTTINPDGHVQGAIARTDSRRGVGKVAAGVEDGLLVGALGVEYELSKGEYDTLYPVGINAILVKSTGVCIFGSRNTYLGGDYPQQNQIRSVIYIEKSLKGGSEWVNFENNDAKTRGRILRQFKSFLRGARRDGVLKGATDNEAFYVICDESNNPESQVRAGKIKARVGLAVNNPSEFFEIEIERDNRALDAELAG